MTDVLGLFLALVCGSGILAPIAQRMAPRAKRLRGPGWAAAVLGALALSVPLLLYAGHLPGGDWVHRLQVLDATRLWALTAAANLFAAATLALILSFGVPWLRAYAERRPAPGNGYLRAYFLIFEIAALAFVLLLYELQMLGFQLPYRG
ncbi:MAG: hypothetical protein J4G09_08080 [Proteobacteria bacterium]|nr:hypothetical protein [Pseudomonadota bacterium]